MNNKRISFKLLVAPYLIILFSVVVILLDLFVLGRPLTEYLPNHPNQIFWWTLIFGLPHILLSIFLQFNKEYIAAYKKRYIFSFVFFLVLSFLVYSLALPDSHLGSVLIVIFQIFYIGYTMYHVLLQQFGINLAIGKMKPTIMYNLWKFLGVASVVILFSVGLFGTLLQILFNKLLVSTINITPYISILSLFLLALFMALGLSIFKSSSSKKFRFFVICNLLLITSTVLLFFTPYIIFSFIIPRVIHDITAFSVYLTHDSNNRSNILYSSLVTVGLPYLLVGPILAFLLSSLTHLPSLEFLSFLVIAITLFHYYIEGFVWKSDSPHRKYISFESD